MTVVGRTLLNVAEGIRAWAAWECTAEADQGAQALEERTINSVGDLSHGTKSHVQGRFQCGFRTINAPLLFLSLGRTKAEPGYVCQRPKDKETRQVIDLHLRALEGLNIDQMSLSVAWASRSCWLIIGHFHEESHSECLHGIWGRDGMNSPFGAWWSTTFPRE